MSRRMPFLWPVRKDALKAVLPQFVPRMAHKWDSIGIQLAQAERVHVSQLQNSPEPNEKKMQDILDAWIESADRVPINTRPLLDILKSSDVGLHDVAKDLDEATQAEHYRRHREALQRREEVLQRREEMTQRLEEFRKWQRAYEEALHNQVSVSVEIRPCVFIGSSAAGKSTLKHLLVHDTPKEIKTSTAIIDTPQVVTVSAEQYAVERGSSAWQLVDDDVMGKALCECIKGKECIEGSKLPQKDDTVLCVERKGSPILHPLATGITAAKESGGSNVLSKYVLIERYKSVKLEGTSFIHLLDTGGQPSFQDALPLLLDVPCTYIQVFNAAQDLDQPVPITYRRDDHTEETLPPSTETEWEMMLRSFSSMQTMAQKHAKELATFQWEEGQLPCLNIFVVGTFKDQLMKEVRHEEIVQDISKRLNDLDGKPYYKCIKADTTASRPFYLINSIAGKEEDRSSVNSLRKRLFEKESSFKLKIPLRWYVCKQHTQGMPRKFFRFQDLKAFCLEHKFIDANGADEQFRSLLKLFSLLGFYVFFDLKDVPNEANYICTDKGVFLKEVSKLLAVQFLQVYGAVREFKQNGIISNNAEIFTELGILAEVDRSWFLAALEHIGLLARYTSVANPFSYFMPIALPQGKTKLPDCSSVASLCVTFTFHSPDNSLVYTDLPRGVFCRLAVQLCKGPWNPVPKASDRTTVKFQAEEFTLYLTEAPGFIRLTPVLVEKLEGKELLAELHRLCSKVYGTLHKSVIPSAEDVLGEQFCQTAKIVFGFECSCGNVPHLAILATPRAKSLICQAGKKERRPLSDRERIWFAPVESPELVEMEVDGCSMWVMKETGGPSRDPPQTGHLQKKVYTPQYQASSDRRAVSPQKSAEQVLDHFRRRFIDYMDANAIVHELVHQSIIANGDLTTIMRTPDARQQNEILHACLLKTCDEEALMKVCEIIVRRGYPTMRALGKDMKSMLQEGTTPPQPTPLPPQPTPQPPQPTPQPPQPTPQPPQPTPWPPQPTPQPPQPTPRPPQLTPQPPQPTPDQAKRVLEFFRELFISEVASKDIVHDLQCRDIIPDGVLTAVTRESGAALQNKILYAHLESTCTWESLMTLCETIIAVPGNPRMQRFGENMKSKLEEETAPPQPTPQPPQPTPQPPQPTPQPPQPTPRLPQPTPQPPQPTPQPPQPTPQPPQPTPQPPQPTPQPPQPTPQPPQPTPRPPQPTPDEATLLQVIQDHTEQFLEEMNSKVLAHRLKALGLIPAIVETDLLQSKSREDANAHLLQHLKDDADMKSVMEIFRIASQEPGYGRMNTLADVVLRKLQQES